MITNFDEFISQPLNEDIDKQISGVKETIEIKGHGTVKAKLDSGNSAINALIVDEYDEHDGTVDWTFNGEVVHSKVIDHCNIVHLGKCITRPVIEVDLIFNGKEYKNEKVNLKISDYKRPRMRLYTRMLLSKEFLTRANILIDPGKQYHLSNLSDIDRPSKKLRNETKKND